MARVSASAKPPTEGALSPVKWITRAIRSAVQLTLYGRAAGHCQFESCKLDLTAHRVTKTPGNYGEKAHIVAFRKQGPRGETLERPDDINSVENLMLLCPGCHRHIDRHAADYPRHRLEEMKRAHEEHVRASMAQRPDLRTQVLIFQAPIGAKPAMVSEQHTRDAILPRYPATADGVRIDLNSLASQGETKEFYEAAATQIREEIGALYRASGHFKELAHTSVFALGPIPLLVEFGARLTDKVSADFFQKHQDTENWTWKTDGEPVTYEFERVRKGASGSPVALLLSLSGPISQNDLPAGLKETAALYELRLTGRAALRTFLRTRADLDNFRIAYIEALSRIAADHGIGEPVHLIPAIPAPVALICGRARHPKAHGPLLVYDLDRDKGGYLFRTEIKT